MSKRPAVPTAEAGIVSTKVCCYLACVTSLCGPTALVDETAKAIAALHLAVHRRGYIGRSMGPALAQALVRPSLVIVLDDLRIALARR